MKGNDNMDYKLLNNDLSIPQLGYGVWKIPNEEAAQAVENAYDAGYSQDDTGKDYGNEQGVGEALEKNNNYLKELFITTKLWNCDQGYDNTLKAFDESLGKLAHNYVDLYLIHWPTQA